ARHVPAPRLLRGKRSAGDSSCFDFAIPARVGPNHCSSKLKSMRFPFALSAKIAAHIIKHNLRRTPKFAMVLQLEPLHTCNLTCTGCGRIREYSTNLKDMVPLEKCLAVAEECEAPMVSICGGEPLIYPKIEELVAGLLEQGRIVYVCTNGMFMRKKMRDYLSSIYNPTLEPTLTKLSAEKLISDKDVETIRK